MAHVITWAGIVDHGLVVVVLRGVPGAVLLGYDHVVSVWHRRLISTITISVKLRKLRARYLMHGGRYGLECCRVSWIVIFQVLYFIARIIRRASSEWGKPV